MITQTPPPLPSAPVCLPICPLRTLIRISGLWQRFWRDSHRGESLGESFYPLECQFWIPLGGGLDPLEAKSGC